MTEGLTPTKKEGLKQMMGKYSGKASLSELLDENEDCLEDIERDCTPLESLEQSLKEMKLMREGKLPKKFWEEVKAELDQSNSLEQDKYGEDI